MTRKELREKHFSKNKYGCIRVDKKWMQSGRYEYVVRAEGDNYHTFHDQTDFVKANSQAEAQIKAKALELISIDCYGGSGGFRKPRVVGRLIRYLPENGPMEGEEDNED